MHLSTFPFCPHLCSGEDLDPLAMWERTEGSPCLFSHLEVRSDLTQTLARISVALIIEQKCGFVGERTC